MDEYTTHSTTTGETNGEERSGRFLPPHEGWKVSTPGDLTMNIEHLVLGGERVPAAEGKTFAVTEPGTGKPFTEVAEAGTEDVQRAVQIAYRAFEEGKWPRLSATDRGRILLQAAALVRERLEDIAVIEARNAGKPIRDTGCWPRSDAPRTGGSLCPDHSVELPPRHCVLETRPCPGMRQYHSGETCPAYTPVSSHAG